MQYKVALIMGSDSDLPVINKAITILNDFKVPFEAHIMSAHRTPKRAVQFAEKANENGFGVIIAAAGMAAHLAGVLAAHTCLPVIGLPCKGGAGDGIDALLSTVQMPPGVPVATVGLNAGANAAILAVQMLAISNEMLQEKLKQFKTKMAKDVQKKDVELQKKLKNAKGE